MVTILYSHGHVHEFRVWSEMHALQKLCEHGSVDGSFITKLHIRLLTTSDCILPPVLVLPVLSPHLLLSSPLLQIPVVDDGVVFIERSIVSIVSSGGEEGGRVMNCNTGALFLHMLFIVSSCF